MKPLALKSLITLAILLGLLIPLSMVSSMVNERRERLTAVSIEMSNSWGGSNTALGGLFISAGEETVMPEKNKIEGTITAEVRQKGIFKIPFYTANLVFRASFSRLPGGEGKKINLSIFNNRSIEIKQVKINGKAVSFSPRNNNDLNNALIIASCPSSGGDMVEITVNATMKGIDKVLFQQVSPGMNVKLKSNWSDPNFTGSVLPARREINNDGFQAEWDFDGFINGTGKSPHIFSDEDSFGVSLFIPVNVYTLTDRSIKYAVLFTGLTFLAFFLFEISGGIRIHPFQYLLVGFALTVFYLLLLSLSEFISFGLSYLTAALATIGLIVMYSISVLKTTGRTVIMGAMLVLLYSFLYILLQLDQYSLLLGSLAIFIILALVMYYTRNINWYEVQEK